MNDSARTRSRLPDTAERVRIWIRERDSWPRYDRRFGAVGVRAPVSITDGRAGVDLDVRTIVETRAVADVPVTRDAAQDHLAGTIHATPIASPGAPVVLLMATVANALRVGDWMNGAAA